MTETIRQYFTRPHRQIYYPFDLGPSQLVVSSRKCIRHDFHILNTVSFYQGQDDNKENCLIYLHTHNGSKLEALPMTEHILAMGLNYCIFDFAGYGNSEGKTVSLGCREIWDIQAVINHLHNNFNQHKFILWGRSMGAVAALLYLATKMAATSQIGEKMSKQLCVIGGIYDSPFQSLEKLTLEIGAKASSLPQFLLSPLIYFIKNSLKEDINFQELELAQKIRSIKIPGVFLTSHQDNFVHYSHSESLYKEYGGRKELIYIERDHNQSRKEEDLASVYSFIKKINSENPKRWQTVLTNNRNFHRKNGKSIFSLIPHMKN